MNLADILKDIGNEGPFQIVALLILAMPKMPIQWSMTMMSYAAYEPVWCCVPEDVQVDENCVEHGINPLTNASNEVSYRSSYRHCKLNSTVCSRWVFLDKDGASTAVTEWALVCEHQWIVSSLSSVQMGGVMVGALASGSLSDHFGRKKVHFATILIHTLLNLAAGFSNSWVMFAIFRFFIGATIGGYLVVHVPYILEFVSPKWRVIPASLPFAAIGASLLPFVAWLLPDWRWMHFICAMLCAPFILGYFYLPESVRWLTVKGRVEEAAKVVDLIAQMNRKEYNPVKCLKKIQKVAEREKQILEKGKKYSYLDIYRGWKMARLTLTLQFVWFTTSLVGYGIILGISSLAGNLYLNMFLVEAVEIPVIMATYYFNNCIGRRYTAIVYFCLATSTAFCAFIFHLAESMPHRDMAITMMCIGCRTFVAGAAAVFIVVSTEVYPTVIRTLGYGAANTAAKIGGVLAPFIINMDAIPTVSYSVMFVTCLICVAAVLSLKETKNLVMEDTLEKSGSKLSISSSLGCPQDKMRSLRRSVSQPRIIIDFDTDLIHHKSYSEFEDDSDDESDEVKLVRRTKRGREKAPLLIQRRLMYDPSLASNSQNNDVSCKMGSYEADSTTDTVQDTEDNSDSFGEGGCINSGFNTVPDKKDNQSMSDTTLSLENESSEPNMDKQADFETLPTEDVCGSSVIQGNVDSIKGDIQTEQQSKFAQEY